MTTPTKERKPPRKRPVRDDRGDEPRDKPVDQLDYEWNAPGAPFRGGDY